MKSLKSYKLFESSDLRDEIKNNLQDILVDFTDNGIEVEVTHDQERFLVRIGKVYSLALYPYRSVYNFVPISYKDELTRVLSYMESEDYEISTCSYYDHNGVVHAFNKNNHNPLSTLFSIDETTNLKLFFRKKVSGAVSLRVKNNKKEI